MAAYLHKIALHMHCVHAGKVGDYDAVFFYPCACVETGFYLIAGILPFNGLLHNLANVLPASYADCDTNKKKIVHFPNITLPDLEEERKEGNKL